MDEPNPLTRVIKPVVAVQEAVKPVAEPAKKKLQVPKLFDVETSLGIGDVMTVLTLLPGLRQKYPDWTIRVITEKPDWANLGHDYAIRRSEFEASNTVGELNFKQTELGGDWRN